MRRSLLFLVVFVVTVFAAQALSAAALLVAFRGEDEGGVARVLLDSAGRPAAPAEILFRDPAFAGAAKLRVSPDGRHAVLAAEREKGENLAILDLASGAAPRLLALGFTPEEHRIDSAGRSYVGGSDGHLVALDLASGAITHRWNSRRDLSPPGHKPEDLLVLEPEGILLVSHQKDGKKGRAGSRIAVLRLADLSLVGDLRLPRDRPDLHLSEKEAGPSPEVIRADRAANTLVVTLDRYGALAFANLDAALAGRLQTYAATPTSADGVWGRAFPDRLALARVGDRGVALVSNASADGGLALYDIGARRRLAFFPVEAGCAEPVPVLEGAALATVVSGKRKRALADALENIATPGADLLVLDLARAVDADSGALARFPLGGPVAHIAAIPGHPGLVAVTLLRPGRLLICSVADGRILSTTTLPGRPASLLAW